MRRCQTFFNIFELKSYGRVFPIALIPLFIRRPFFTECTQHAGHAGAALSDVTKLAFLAPSARKLGWNALNKDRYAGSKV